MIVQTILSKHDQFFRKYLSPKLFLRKREDMEKEDNTGNTQTTLSLVSVHGPTMNA